MMLLPLIFSPSFQRKFAREPVGGLDRTGRGPAWMPSLFKIVSSLVKNSLSGGFFALIGLLILH